MRLTINNEPVVIPSSLSEITLKQRIDYQQEHGDLLNEMLKGIMEIEDEDLKELELINFQFEKMYRSIAFFIGSTVEAVKESQLVDQLFGIYIASIEQVFNDEEREIELMRTEFAWKDDIWLIHEPELKNGDQMTFGEFIDSKQMVQDMIGLGKNRWECLLPLCTIFLRKENEVYEEKFLYDKSERLKLMEDLPLDIALQVGFFLSSSLKIFSETFQSSMPQELKTTEQI